MRLMSTQAVKSARQMRGSYMAHAWLMYGSCMAHAWLMHSSCVAHAWLMRATLQHCAGIKERQL